MGQINEHSDSDSDTTDSKREQVSVSRNLGIITLGMRRRRDGLDAVSD